jgi:hypothetical protein
MNVGPSRRWDRLHWAQMAFRRDRPLSIYFCATVHMPHNLDMVRTMASGPRQGGCPHPGLREQMPSPGRTSAFLLRSERSVCKNPRLTGIHFEGGAWQRMPSLFGCGLAPSHRTLSKLCGKSLGRVQKCSSMSRALSARPLSEPVRST